MQNKLVNTDESINIDELEKSKTISLTSNRSPDLKLGLEMSLSSLLHFLTQNKVGVDDEA